jgi:decaprenylphospho-beta-D-erythro-pentofuranosid-2-ulose 2-reductase
MKKILIVGATSAIATACARLWAAQGACLFLVGRDPGKLHSVAADFKARSSAEIHTWVMDATDLTAQTAMLQAAFQTFGDIDIALIAHGTLPDQHACESDAALVLKEFANNATSVMALLTDLANHFERQRRGSIAVITSVAGDRGRPSNYVYGSAKAAVSTFCEGLRARMFRVGVSVTDIRPGFVATPMTQDMSLPQALVVQPEVVARRMVKAIERRADVVYTPGFWFFIMLLIKSVPRAVFKRMKL